MPDRKTCPFCSALIKEETFVSHLNKTGECWIWNGQKDRKGYGRHCHALAHRLAWEFFVGPIPDEFCVLHRCDNPPCCNPAHLFLGTHTENMADMQAKGRRRTRGLKGEENPFAVLTDDLVRKIRQLYGPKRGKGVKGVGLSQHQVAAQLGISRAAVEGVITGRRWGHI